MHPLHAAVDGLMRRIGRDVLMAHFQKLDAGDIEEKAPDDYVTIADKQSEAQLIEGLTALIAGSHVVGEEGVAADPALVAEATQGTAWIVDPLDGTGNFAAGRTPFAIMVALAESGVVQAGWILDPVTRRMCHAVLGGGAFIDNRRIEARPTGAAQPIGALATRFLPAEVRAQVIDRAEGHVSIVDIPHCAGEQYPRLVLGTNDLALFWRAMPWDHAPGALFLEEAGGRIARIDGKPYRLGDDRPGLLAAASPRLWDETAEQLFG
ncbi:MAG TPA: inositol monophosphatase family protein [Sphingomonas sp.]|nr:inositol monophosphatase family protein [Sphingomonas sp.]